MLYQLSYWVVRTWVCRARAGRAFAGSFAALGKMPLAFGQPVFAVRAAPSPAARLRSRFDVVTLGLGALVGVASRLRGQNAAHAFGVRLFLACRRSIAPGAPTLALRFWQEWVESNHRCGSQSPVP